MESSSTSDNNDNTFDRMRSFERRLAKIERSGPSCLEKFYEPHLLSFSIRPGTTSRISITSTCFALQTILSSDRSLYESTVNYDDAAAAQQSSSNNNKIPIPAMMEALLLAEWREEDLFQ